MIKILFFSLFSASAIFAAYSADSTNTPESKSINTNRQTQSKPKKSRTRQNWITFNGCTIEVKIPCNDTLATLSLTDDFGDVQEYQFDASETFLLPVFGMEGTYDVEISTDTGQYFHTSFSL